MGAAEMLEETPQVYSSSLGFLCALAYGARCIAVSRQFPKLSETISSRYERNLDYVKSVLLADDSAVVRKTLRKVFEQSGWSVCADVSDGEEAIAKAQQLLPDIIVLDFSMPTMNGLTAGRILKCLLPKTPLILFTSFGKILTLDDLESAGFSALIDKNEAGKLVPTAQSLIDSSL
jgi:CheY-like chemotaxis protein